MTERGDVIREIASNYGTPTIGFVGSHCAIEVGTAAKKAGFRTYLIAQKGREDLYLRQYPHLYDEVMLLDKFSDVLEEENQKKLRENNVVIIPSRSFFVYLDRHEQGSIEDRFDVPIFGSRNLLAAEDVTTTPNQYNIMEKAGISIPEVVKTPKEIDDVPYPVIIKVKQKNRPLERMFPVVCSYEDYQELTSEMLKKDLVSEEGLKAARLEEYCVGIYYNANSHVRTPYFRNKIVVKPFTTLHPFDFVGFGQRDQVNESGFRNLPAKTQLELEKSGYTRTMEEVGHKCVTMRESLIPQPIDATEKLVNTLEEEVSPGMIGMFGVQGIVTIDEKQKPIFKTFDLSFRVPGDPAIAGGSPYLAPLGLKYEGILRMLRENSKIRGGFKLKKIEAPLDLTMMEIAYAHHHGDLASIVT